VVVRIVSVVAALVVAAWFALGVRESHELNTVTSLLAGNPRLTAGQAAHADGLLSSAGTLNPDHQEQLLRGEVALAAGNVAAAQRIVLNVAHQEPDNIAVWDELARAAGSNHRLILLAFDNFLRLSPRLRTH
jgi:predicted Zn-dependent protease